MPRFPLTVPTLSVATLHLRALTEADIPGWFARASDPEFAALAGDPIPESIAMGLQWLQGHQARFRQQAAIRWAIVPQGSAESVGTVGLTIISAAARTAELGLAIGRAHWNQGIGTAAARLVTRYAFDTLGLAGIQAEILQRNLASRRLLEKLGFHFLRTMPADLPSDSASNECHLYVLQDPSGAAA